MKVLYSPQLNPNNFVSYKFEGDKIHAKMGGITDTFDFTEVEEGIFKLFIEDDEKGQVYEVIETTLPVNPINYVERREGELYIKLLYFYDEYEERNEILFPEWKDVADLPK